ncbi:hypothetical protein FGIG_05309 [Fasciola gigantica]|uniref:Uncharacterized protein n=1 Tax=Fasciola gigantica TaxID=46835 RepID=A0A504Z1Z0_FASGI|nr:hypothetical protein FGIG_05309 [Fasciola gigantica]
MPKYCVEFIADVCTLPSQEDSDWTDSRDQEPFTVNPLSESDWDIRLTPFIVPDPNKVAPSSHNIYPANCPNLKPSLLQNRNPCCWDPTSRNCAKDKTVCQSSHVTSMGNTACCVPDGRKIIWDEYERHPSSTVNCYAHDTVPIHRTFVISRAVQCSSCPSTEQTMHNNHSYHDIQIPHESSRGGPQYQQYSFTVNKTITSQHNPKHLTFFPRDFLDSEGRTDESKQNSHKITSVRSNSEMSVDVSSLSAQRCSSVTPPVKNTVDYALETNRDLMHSNALLLEDDIDSLSATISAGSNSNFRETSKRHRQRPSPYTRPKLKSSGQNEIGRHFSNAFALDRSEHRQRGPKKRQSSLHPMFGVSAFGDGLIQKSSQICFDKSTLIGLEDGYQLGPVQEPHPQTHTNEVETDGIIGSNVRPTQDRSDLGDSASTLEETSSQCKPVAGILKEKQPNIRLSRSLERTTTIDSLDFSELPKTPKRRESFCSTSPTKKSENLFIPLKAQLSTQARLQLPKDIELITSWDHKQLPSEPLSSVASCMELQRPRTSPSLLRTGRQSLMRKRNSAPISLKLPQPTPTTKITAESTATTKPTPTIIPTTTRLSVMRRRSNESILSAPLHIYTPHSRCRGKLVRHKFFIPESANIEAILADPDDRRIKAICERYKCDMEIYSKLPWCGFLQYIIVLAARDTATLRRCARTLDCRLNWCLDAQIR